LLSLKSPLSEGFFLLYSNKLGMALRYNLYFVILGLLINTFFSSCSVFIKNSDEIKYNGINIAFNSGKKFTTFDPVYCKYELTGSVLSQFYEGLYTGMKKSDKT
jgi:hypothetical protein